MNAALLFEDQANGNIACTLNLDALYTPKELEAFNVRWAEFLNSDKNNALVLKRQGNIIIYPHKSWLPEEQNGRPSLMLLFGNPAPHSVLKDVYFAYEGRGAEHRFWKVLRELGFTDLVGNDSDIKTKFLNLDHAAPFRLGFEVIYTFPSSASKPKWSGVLGIQRLFGKRAMGVITVLEEKRIRACISYFLAKGGAIIALQKDAYNTISQNPYDLKLATEGKLNSFYNDIPIYGTPPTRWLYTTKMKDLLLSIKESLMH
jgi:hypothetical protein